jgi:hypothetical protein
MRRRAALRALAAVALAGCAADPMGPQAMPETVLDRELAAITNDSDRPLASLSVLAIRDGRVAYERHFGRR